MMNSNIGTRFWSNQTDQFHGNDLNRTEVLINHGIAIKNFVNIATGDSIPVRFHKSRDSYTDGKTITIDATLHHGNLDVTVGIALHEASHIKYTSFGSLNMPKFLEICRKGGFKIVTPAHLKTILNVIEDRRIDAIMKRDNPGYRVYYQALEDNFFNNQFITKKLQQSHPENIESYIFFLINMINPTIDVNKLTLFPEIYQLIDLPNITRLASTDDALNLSVQVATIIERLPQAIAEKKEQRKKQQQSSSESTEDEQTSNDDSTGKPDSETSNNEPAPDIDPQTARAMKQQKEFVNGEMEKKSIESLRNIDDNINKYLDIDIQQNEFTPGSLSIAGMVDMNDSNTASMFEGFGWGNLTKALMKENPRIHKHITEGIHLGNQLSNKMKLRRETVVDTSRRQLTGKFDKRMAASLGAGVESVFKRVSITSFDPVSIFISIDCSGSMKAQSKFESTIKLTAAIMQCFSKFKNYRVHVTARYSSQIAMSLLVFDSKIHSISAGIVNLSKLEPSGGTPEGMCFPSIDKTLLRDLSKNEVYFINISDGEPNSTAIEPTTKYISKWKRSGITVMSYLIGHNISSTQKLFKRMYGEESSVILSTLDVNTVAKQLNGMLMKKVYASR